MIAPDRAEDGEVVAHVLPPSSSHNAWQVVADKVAEAIEQHPDRRYVTLWWLKVSPRGPGFTQYEIDRAAVAGHVVVEVKADRNPHGVAVARLVRPQDVDRDHAAALPRRSVVCHAPSHHHDSVGQQMACASGYGPTR